MSSNDLQSIIERAMLASRHQIQEAKWAVCGTRRTWMDQLLLAGAFSEDQLVQCLSGALHLTRCDLGRLAAVPADVLALVPRDVALAHRIVPLWLDSDGAVRVAMADPTDLAGLAEAEFFIGRSVMREVAAGTAIAWALGRYYRAPGNGSHAVAPPARLARQPQGRSAPPASMQPVLATCFV